MPPVDNGARTGALMFAADHCGWVVMLVLLSYDVKVVLSIAPGRGQLRRRHCGFWG